MSLKIQAGHYYKDEEDTVYYIQTKSEITKHWICNHVSKNQGLKRNVIISEARGLTKIDRFDAHKLAMEHIKSLLEKHMAFGPNLKDSKIHYKFGVNDAVFRILQQEDDFEWIVNTIGPSGLQIETSVNYKVFLGSLDAFSAYNKCMGIIDSILHECMNFPLSKKKEVGKFSSQDVEPDSNVPFYLMYQ